MINYVFILFLPTLDDLSLHCKSSRSPLILSKNTDVRNIVNQNATTLAAPKPAKKKLLQEQPFRINFPKPYMDCSAPSQLLDNNNTVIDYDQLAAAIIRQQQQAATGRKWKH